MPITMTALALGGNVRLGFEDNIFLHKGVKAKENAELVGRVARLAQEWDRACATPDEARRILKLGKYAAI
jgi:3-keto-5-aminohexanoate cleavage enzyme